MSLSASWLLCVLEAFHTLKYWRGVDFMVNTIIMRLTVINAELERGQLMHWRARLSFRGTSSSCRSGTTGTLWSWTKTTPKSFTWDGITPFMSVGLGADWLESSFAEGDPGILEDKLDESASLKADCVLNCAGKSVALRLREVVIPVWVLWSCSRTTVSSVGLFQTGHER